MQKRPPITPEMIRQVTNKIAEKHEMGDPDVLADNYRYPMNGMELAITLARREGWDYGCELDEELIEDFDAIDMDVAALHKVAVKKWFEENDIQPPLPIGTQIKQGQIDGIDEYGIARFKVKRPEDEGKQRWLLVNFEDAEAV
tara:strand:- start:107 stop:535 length:429 start_codon:yes stop_codon:yes gene_type:complete